MIDRIISFITYFPGNLHFYIGEYEFNGLCLQPRTDFPWSSKRERNKFLEDIAESDEVEEMDRLLYWSGEWQLEVIHQRFSWAFMLGVMMCFWLIIGLLAWVGGAGPVSLFFLMVSFGSLIGHYFLRRSVGKWYFRWHFTKMIVNAVKQDRIEKNNHSIKQ